MRAYAELAARAHVQVESRRGAHYRAFVTPEASCSEGVSTEIAMATSSFKASLPSLPKFERDAIASSI